MKIVKGSVMERREIPCTRCGTITVRACHFVDAKCKACRLRRDRATEYEGNKRTREQARRYRILLAIGPYRTYEELYRAIRVRNPHRLALEARRSE